MTGFDGRSLETIERVLGQDAVMTDAFHLEQFAIDLVSELSQIRKIVNRFADVKVHRVVNRRFGAEGVLLFEVLLHV